MSTVLNTITTYRRQDIKALQNEFSLDDFKETLVPSTRDFYTALRHDQPAFILECKKASPSRGLIRQDFDVASIIETYDRYASVISVLAENRHFQGEFDYIKIASEHSSKPILCKDFIVDAYQIYLARYYQADAVLLMLSVLSDEEYRTFSDIAHQLNMGVLTEVNDEEEVERAIALQAKVIGINNRDLRDLSIDTGKTARLSLLIPKDRLIISESGILTHHDMKQLRPHADGFLIGSALMEQDDLGFAVHTMVKGHHKVCGITRKEDLEAAFKAGASYVGLIFVLTSPRGIAIAKAKEITKGVSTNFPLKLIGVFQNDDIETITHIAKEIGLYAVQLHGQEPQEFISKLRESLPTQVKIIKAVSVINEIPRVDYDHVDYYLLDGKTGGSGIPFNWDLLEGRDLSKVFIAGGLNKDNAEQALHYHPLGLDLNSGVELSPGIKDHKKLDELFQIIQLL